MSLEQASDRNAFLSALISGGIIGGLVTLVEGNFDKSKFVFPAAVLAAITADYQVTKYRNEADIEVVAGYVKKMRAMKTDNVKRIRAIKTDHEQSQERFLDDHYRDQEERQTFEREYAKREREFEREYAERETEIESIEYVNTVLASLLSVLTIVGGGYLVSQVNLSKWYTGFPFSRWYGDTQQKPMPTIIEESEFLPGPTVHDGISIIASPAVLQFGVALARGQVRHAGRAMVAQLVAQSLTNIDYSGSLMRALEAGKELGGAIQEQTVRLSESIVDLFSRRVEGVNLTNERVVVLEDAAANRSYVGLIGDGDSNLAPAVRLQNSVFDGIQTDFEARLNLRPRSVSEASFFSTASELNDPELLRLNPRSWMNLSDEEKLDWFHTQEIAQYAAYGDSELYPEQVERIMKQTLADYSKAHTPSPYTIIPDSK